MDLHLRDAFFASTHYVHSGRNALIGCFNLLILLLSILLYFRLRPTTSENERISQKQFWISHPMSGMRNEWLSWARVTLRSVFGTKAMVDNGYKSVRELVYRAKILRSFV